MEAKSIDEMTNEEFDTFVTQVQEAEFDQISFPSFMDMLWAFGAQRSTEVIEISAKLVNGDLHLEAPPDILVRGNELILGDRRIVIKWAGA
jgi:hypothetical protein